MKKSIKQKIVDRLRSECDIEIPEGEYPRRLYHGHWQRCSGAWSWAIGGTPKMLPSYGSQYSMKECLSFKKFDLFREVGGDVSILPFEEPKAK